MLLACSVHPDDRLLQSIAYVHGRGNPYAVTGMGLDQEDASAMAAPSSADVARAVVHRILFTGGEPAVGLLPVRLDWAEQFGKSPGDVLEPCGNVAIASAKISEFDHACRSKGPRSSAAARRTCTLGRYGASLGLPALMRAVMADLTLPSAFEVETADLSSLLAALPFPTDASPGLFFPVASAPRALSLQPEPQGDELAP